MTPPDRNAPTEPHRSVSLLRPRSFGQSDPLDLDTAPPLVLIVDDDPVFRMVVRGYLEHAGFRLEEAEDGPSALAMFEEIGADIVLLDIMMPGIDGFETCVALRGLPGGRTTPIVMMTGVDDLESIERAYEVGATDFIVKPVNAFILTRRLQHILRANRYLAHFDDLTALPKRDLFLEHLQTEIAAGRRGDHYVAILYLALDGFRRFNDTLGHRAGDQILRQVATRLGELRASDYFARNEEEHEVDGASSGRRPVGRFGGDEFMILLSDIRHERDIGVVARRVNRIVSRPFEVGGEEIRVTTSIGISVYPMDGSEPALLLEHAAVAMNHAKRRGRGGYQFYSENLNGRTQRRLFVENTLRRALERDQLEVQYQPKVDIQRNQIAGVEALVRMPPLHGESVPPSEFIPVAEETGLITHLGDWVFRNACAGFAKLQRPESPRFSVAINLSTAQFMQEDLPSIMLRKLEQIDLEPSCVELELTEGTLLENTEASFATLRELKDLGFRIAVDDFGTGYSSLSYLGRFPLDVLKIDQSFIRDLPYTHSDCAIVESIIDLGHKLSLEIVAEGVEHRRQLEFLIDRGCDQVQGFLYSAAMSLEDLDDWITRWDAVSNLAMLQTLRDSLRSARDETPS